MLNEFASKVDPKVITAVKVGAIAVGVIAGVIVVGVVLNKMGLLETGSEMIEEVTEAAVSAA